MTGSEREKARDDFAKAAAAMREAAQEPPLKDWTPFQKRHPLCSMLDGHRIYKHASDCAHKHEHAAPIEFVTDDERRTTEATCGCGATGTVNWCGTKLDGVMQTNTLLADRLGERDWYVKRLQEDNQRAEEKIRKLEAELGPTRTRKAYGR